MSYEYIYSIEDNFPNAKVDIDALTYEIRESAITIAVDYIYNKDEIECRIYMKAKLSEEEHTMLDEIVAVHSGEPLNIRTTTTADKTQIVNAHFKPVDVDSEGRMKVLSYVTPKEHELSGPQHIGTLSNEQLPDCVARCTDITSLSGILTENMHEFANQYYNIPEIDDLLLTKSPIAHQHDLRYYKQSEVDDKIITTHGELGGLDNDDHTQYLTAFRGDDRYYTKDYITSVSGLLQTQISNKADVSHLHDDRYYTESEIDIELSNKSDISHNHLHSALIGLSNDDHPQYLLADGSRHLNGDLVISGNLSISGTHFITNTEVVEVEDNLIIINKGEQGNGVTAGVAGIEIDRGTGAPYRFVFDESSKLFKVGVSGTEDSVAIVQDATIIEGYIPYWKYHNDAIAHYELSITDSMHINNVASKDLVSSTAISLQQNIDNKSDLGHTHVQQDITNLVHDAVKIRGKDIDKPQPEDDGKRIVYDASGEKFKLEHSGAGGGGVSFPFSYFHRVSSLEKVSTTVYGYKWYEKTKLVVEDIPTGLYRIGWYYQWLCTSTSRSITVRLIEDGVELDDYRFDGILYTEVEPKDYRCYYTDGGFRYIDLKEGSHTFRLQFHINRSGGVVYMWNAEIEFWKVG